MPGKAIVIGGGFGGMAAALRLRARGYDVTLIEKNPQLGGRAMVWRRGGFSFDAGPTVITAPFLFDELFQLFGKRREDYVRFVPLDPWYRIQFADGSTFDYGGSIERMCAEIRKFEPRDVEGYRRFIDHAKRIYDIAFTRLGDRPFETIGSMIRCVPDFLRLGAWRTVWQMAEQYFRNEKLRRVFSFQPLLIGGNPLSTPSFYSLIHTLEREHGVWFAMGGTGAIVAALEKLMRETEIEIRLGAEAASICVSRTRAGRPRHLQGIALSTGERLAADVVVTNEDPPSVYRNRLIDSDDRPVIADGWTKRRRARFKQSMGLFVLYFGTTKQYPQIAHHTIILGEKYRDLLKEMFDRKTLELSDLSLYLHRPTATDPTLAPAGCDAWYALVPVPNLQGGQDWSQLEPRYREVVIDCLERSALPGLRECIVEAFSVTPEYFRDTLNTLHGAGFSIQPTLGQSAYFRFHNRSDEIDGLYFVGAGTHPGAGVPGVLCSAKVLEKVLP